MEKDVFISYSRRDSVVADRICRALDRAGISYFIDRQGIAGGMEFPEVLANAIVGCKIFLFVASRNSYQSDYTNNEITFAFNRKRRMLPYIIDGSALPIALEFTFARINRRTIEEHPIDTVLVDDLLDLLGRQKTTSQAATTRRLSAPEMHQYGCIAYIEQKYAEAVEWFTKAEGYFLAQNNLGECYYYGRGVPQDYAEAVKWYRKSAEQGNAKAQSNLGVCYYNGQGVPQDYAEAIRWYKKSVEQGDASAQYRLGLCYYYGKGVLEDEVKAFEWFSKSAEQGYIASQNMVAKCYRYGRGIKSDYEEALRWFRKAAAKGNFDAMKGLADCYERGIGVDKDEAEAVEWYRKAAVQGHGSSMYALGYRYYIGYYVGTELKRDYTEAVKWLLNAAQKNIVGAMPYLAECYYEGKGVPKDYGEAIKWYKKAAAQGNFSAQFALSKLGVK